MMMDVDKMRAALSDRNIREVARRCGVSYPTLIALMNPDKPIVSGYKTLAKISSYLEGNP